MSLEPLENLAPFEVIENWSRDKRESNRAVVVSLLRQAADFLEERQADTTVYDVTFTYCNDYVFLTVYVDASFHKGPMTDEQIAALEARLEAGDTATDDELSRYEATRLPWEDDEFIPPAIFRALEQRDNALREMMRQHQPPEQR